MALTSSSASPSTAASAIKLNDNTGGWDVLDFELSPDGNSVAYMADDYANSGLEALYAVPADRSSVPATLYAQTSGAALGIHEYRFTGDSARVVYRGDTETDGVSELFSVDLVQGIRIFGTDSSPVIFRHGRWSFPSSTVDIGYPQPPRAQLGGFEIWRVWGREGMSRSGRLMATPA